MLAGTMKYEDLQKAMSRLANALDDRTDFIRKTADTVITQLTSEAHGIPEGEIFLQSLDQDIENEEPVHSIRLPSENADDELGFRIRFSAITRPSGVRVVTLVDWIFSLNDSNIRAKISGDTATIESPLREPGSKTFIDEMVRMTLERINSSIQSMASGEPLSRTIGFHVSKEES